MNRAERRATSSRKVRAIQSICVAAAFIGTPLVVGGSEDTAQAAAPTNPPALSSTTSTAFQDPLGKF